MTTIVTVPRSVISSVTHQDHDGTQWAWPRGAGAVASLRSLVRKGYASETTGVCEGCSSHRAGHAVPVFCIFAGVAFEEK